MTEEIAEAAAGSSRETREGSGAGGVSESVTRNCCGNRRAGEKPSAQQYTALAVAVPRGALCCDEDAGAGHLGAVEVDGVVLGGETAVVEGDRGGRTQLEIKGEGFVVPLLGRVPRLLVLNLVRLRQALVPF